MYRKYSCLLIIFRLHHKHQVHLNLQFWILPLLLWSKLHPLRNPLHQWHKRSLRHICSTRTHNNPERFVIHRVGIYTPVSLYTGINGYLLIVLLFTLRFTCIWFKNPFFSLLKMYYMLCPAGGDGAFNYLIQMRNYNSVPQAVTIVGITLSVLISLFCCTLPSDFYRDINSKIGWCWICNIAGNSFICNSIPYAPIYFMWSATAMALLISGWIINVGRGPL